MCALRWAGPLDKEDIARNGEAVTDVWRVLGQIVTDVDVKLSERRVWLQGVESRRYALLQDFAYGGKGWDAWLDGTHYSATLRYFPGSVPLRAVALDVMPDVSQPSWAPATVAESIEHASRIFASNPWLAQVPMVLDAATPVAHDGTWQVHTSAGGFALQINDASAWSLLAFSGGHALGAMAEWNGRALRILSAWSAASSYWAPELSA